MTPPTLWWLPLRAAMTIYFYKENQPYGCFSNFSPHGVTLQGHHWPTVEHFYQAQKFAGTPEGAVMAVIRQAATPKLAAALGRDPARSLRPDWDVVKRSVMYEGVWEKFVTHGSIREVLLATGDEVLVEDSPTDYFWGCGRDRTGQNHLGQILMAVRDRLRSELP